MRIKKKKKFKNTIFFYLMQLLNGIYLGSNKTLQLQLHHQNFII